MFSPVSKVNLVVRTKIVCLSVRLIVFISIKIRRNGNITGGVGEKLLGEIGEKKDYKTYTCGPTYPRFNAARKKLGKLKK